MSALTGEPRRRVNQNYYAKHREHLAGLKRAKYVRDRDKYLEQQRAYRVAHAEALRKRAREYYYEHRDAILARKASERLHERAGRPERVPHQRREIYPQELVRVSAKGWGCL